MNTPARLIRIIALEIVDSNIYAIQLYGFRTGLMINMILHSRRTCTNLKVDLLSSPAFSSPVVLREKDNTGSRREDNDKDDELNELTCLASSGVLMI